MKLSGLAVLFVGCLAAISSTWAAPAVRQVSDTRPKLTSAQLKLLTVPVTRDQQLAILKAGPLAVRRQVEAGLVSRANLANQSPAAREKMWTDGFDLLPYRVTYPTPESGLEPLAALVSDCVEIREDGSFPPRADQETPVLHLWNPREDVAPILRLHVPNPGTGLLMITFNARFSGFISGKPVLLKWYDNYNSNGTKQTELLPSDAYSKWSCLVPLANETSLSLGVWAPRVVTLGSVTLRKL